MTHAFLHSLNISTLSTWLSLAGFGTVGVVVTTHAPEPPRPFQIEETTISDFEFAMGEAAAGNDSVLDPSSPASESPEPTDFSAPLVETLPAPPELPPLADFDALPDLPEMPATRPSSAVSSPPEARSTASRSSQPPASRPAASTGSSRGGAVAGHTAAGGAGMSETRRLAAGHMPAPAYPAAARRGGQTGTVVVEFTVDQSGRVISAHAANPSPWPLLNNEAVRTVRRWKFPPGPVMKLQRPIVFQLR